MTTIAMATIEVANATNHQLNWLVANFAGIEVRIEQDLGLIALNGNKKYNCYPDGNFSPATQASQGWPIVEDQPFFSEPHPEHGWVARFENIESDSKFKNYKGETRLQSLLRCFVAYVFGEEAVVPDALLTRSAASDADTAETSIPDGDYLLREGAAWFKVKNFSIRIHDTYEGVIADIYKKGDEAEAPVASTYVFDHEVISTER